MAVRELVLRVNAYGRGAAGRFHIRFFPARNRKDGHVRVHTTGSFAVYSRSDGREVTPKGRKARALLAYLLSEAGTKVSKSRLAALLWGDRGEAQARSSLRQALRELRHAVNASREVVLSDREHIWVSADSLLEDPVNPSGAWQDAFEDLDNISPEFDEWLAGERSRRATAYIARLKAEAEELLASERAEEARLLVHQIQAVDVCDEDALRLGMKADFQSGHAAAVVERYRAVAALLQAEFGVLPSDKTRALRDQLLFRLNERRQAGSTRETDQGYFARRASEERFAAASATTEKTRQLHEVLADRYEDIAATLP